jgi:hypothetical protein
MSDFNLIMTKRLNLSDRRTEELVFEDPVQINDGIFSSMSAVVELDPKCGSNFIRAFLHLQSVGYIKLKTVRVAKKRDRVKV